ncbi:MAG: hypothetical protein Q9225_002950 [Loekoesia sp. 1 TL-2023]
MTSFAIVPDAIDDTAAASLRSRASSIITTTTKFSLETLSQDDGSSILAFRERQRPGPASRPRSLLSMTSIARPAPPYTAALDSTLLLPSHQNGDFESIPNSPPVEPAEPPAPEIASIHEVMAPSPVPSSSPSGAVTPSPDTPLDPEDPRAQITYYNNVVRTLDQNYTAELDRLRAQHIQELAAIRNEIDSAYRAQWKSKNREIERIREEAAVEIDQVRKECEANISKMERELLEQKEQKDKEMGMAVEKARHEVEDLWEKRW